MDDNLLSFADDKQGNILSKILLEPELKEKVEEANFYFDKKEERADRALDLLLMTSGWRKFSWKQINDEDFPEVKFAAEKAQFSGIVYDGYDYKPLPGAQLKLISNGKTVTTDREGKFSFSKFDIAANNQIQITAEGHQAQTQTIYNYGQGNNYYLYDNRNRYYKERIPMAAARGGMREEFAEGAAMDAMDIVVAETKIAFRFCCQHLSQLLFPQQQYPLHPLQRLQQTLRAFLRALLP